MALDFSNIKEFHIGNTEVVKVEDENNVILWQKAADPVVDKYTPFFVKDESGVTNTFRIKKNHTNAPTLNIETSTDGTNWSTLGSTSTSALTVSIPARQRLYVRCTSNPWSTSDSYYNSITCAGNYSVGGNIASLRSGSSFTGNETSFGSRAYAYAFGCVFYGSTTLIDAKDLILPYSTLVDACYKSIFDGCTGLKTAPDLNALTLKTECYKSMFRNCSSLTYIKALFTTKITSSTNYTSGWVYGVSSSGVFVKNPNATWDLTGSNGVPTNFTVVYE